MNSLGSIPTATLKHFIHMLSSPCQDLAILPWLHITDHIIQREQNILSVPQSDMEKLKAGTSVCLF